MTWCFEGRVNKRKGVRVIQVVLGGSGRGASTSHCQIADT